MVYPLSSHPICLCLTHDILLLSQALARLPDNKTHTARNDYGVLQMDMDDFEGAVGTLRDLPQDDPIVLYNLGKLDV